MSDIRFSCPCGKTWLNGEVPSLQSEIATNQRAAAASGNAQTLGAENKQTAAHPTPEPRGCPTPGACSCPQAATPAAPTITVSSIRYLRLLEAERENAELRAQLAEWPKFCVIDVMIRNDQVKEWVGAAEKRIGEAERQRDEARKDAVAGWESAIDWAAYAGPYFQEKHALDADVKRLDAARAKLKESK